MTAINQYNPVPVRTSVIVPRDERTMSSTMTMSEYTEILGLMAAHIDQYPAWVKTTGVNCTGCKTTRDIAERMIRERKSQFCLMRRVHGHVYERWDVNEMELPAGATQFQGKRRPTLTSTLANQKLGGSVAQPATWHFEYSEDLSRFDVPQTDAEQLTTWISPKHLDDVRASFERWKRNNPKMPCSEIPTLDGYLYEMTAAYSEPSCQTVVRSWSALVPNAVVDEVLRHIRSKHAGDTCYVCGLEGDLPGLERVQGMQIAGGVCFSNVLQKSSTIKYQAIWHYRRIPIKLEGYRAEYLRVTRNMPISDAATKPTFYYVTFLMPLA